VTKRDLSNLIHFGVGFLFIVINGVRQ